MWIPQGTAAALVAAALLAAAVPAQAQTATDDQAPRQTRAAIELHGGLNVPTFDIADLAEPGPSFGGGLAVEVAPRVWLLAEADFGSHGGADLPGGGTGPDVDVQHFMGKVGYTVYQSADGRLSLLANLGAGAMRFKAEGAASGDTYFAINAGGKLTYAVGNRFDLVLSPQGDIAFTDDEVFGTSDAWIWPVSAGVRVRF